MKPRLETLLRQRELLREHLRWLDDEIAATGSPSEALRPPIPSPVEVEVAPAESAPVAPLPTMATRGQSGSPRFSSSDSDEIAAREFMPDLDKHNIHDEVKRGCMLYAAIAFAGFAAVIAAAYWMR